MRWERSWYMYVEWLKCVSFHLFVPWRLLGTEKGLSVVAAAVVVVVYDDYGTLVHVGPRYSQNRDTDVSHLVTAYDI